MKKIIFALIIVTIAAIGGYLFFKQPKDFAAGLELALAGDSDGAARIWEPLAAAGDAEAQKSLGLAYYFGDGVVKDRTRAAELYTASAAQGHTGAQYLLAGMNRAGIAMEVNFEKAAELYSLTAAKGNADSQFFLGDLNTQGQIDGADPVIGLMWFLTALENGQKGWVQNYIDEAKAGLTEAQISEAKLLSGNCLMSNYQQCGR